jgi:hypothetical protein
MELLSIKELAAISSCELLFPLTVLSSGRSTSPSRPRPAQGYHWKESMTTMPQPQQSTPSATPVSERQRAYFAARLREALDLFGWKRQAYLREHGWSLEYLYQMAQVEPPPEAPVRHIELSPEEAEAKLADLRQRAAARESPGLRWWRQQRRQPQSSMPTS